MQDDDLNRNLIGQGRKGSQVYLRKIQQIQAQIQIIKNKNNLLQKQSDNDIDDQDIKRSVFSQSQFIQNQIHKLKLLLQNFAKQFKDPAAKNKLKQLWKQASKQIQRNKIIVQRIVNEAPRQSFMTKDQKLRNSMIQPRNSRGANTKNIKANHHNNRNSKRDISKQQMRTSSFLNEGNHQSTQQVMDDSQLIFENKLIKQKNQILNHLEQKNQKINQVMNQIALLVDQQGDHINIITDNVDQAGSNLLEANEQLDGAIIQQKKAKRKYCCLAIALLILAIAIIGVVIILTTSNQSSK